jgi:aryl-alcohol dehydrogenase-like predicted oxidoreductase
LGGRKPLTNADGGKFSSEASVLKDEQGQAIVEEVVAIAKDINEEPASVAVAWVTARGFFPVIGPRNLDQLVANLRATDLQLDPVFLTRLDKVSARRAGYPYELLAQQRAQLSINDPQTGKIL